MTSLLIPTVVTDLLEHEVSNVMKRVVHDLGRRYDFDRKEAYDFLMDKYKMEVMPEGEERVKVTRRCDMSKRKEVHPILEKVKETTRCRARTYYRGVYGQCTRCWNSQFTQLCKNHEDKQLRYGRVDDGSGVEEEVKKVKTFM